jgi:hypothetical protein
VQAVGDTIPQLVRPPGGTFLALTVSEAEFGPGDPFRAALRVTHGASARSVDFYLGHVAPDGVSVTFITSLSPLAGVAGNVNQPESFQPLFRNVEIQPGFDVSAPDAVFVVALPADFPQGRSVLFAAITAAGTADVVAFVTAEFTFEP